MRLQTAKVIGTPTKTAWAQVHTFGKLVVALSVANPPQETEAVVLGKQILEKLNEGYYRSEKETPFEALLEAVSQAPEQFQAEVEIAALLIWGKYAYLCVFGGGQAALWRSNQLFLLLDSDKNEVASLSGKLEPKDVFIVGTNAFFNTVGAETLSAVLGKSTIPEDIADGFAPLVHAKSLPSLASALVKAPVVEEEKKEEASVLNKISQKAKNMAVALALKLPAKEVSAQSAPRRTAVSAGLILILLLLVSIALGIRQKNLRDYRSAYEDRLVRAETLYQDAVLQKDIDKTRAREPFLESKSLTAALTAEGVKDRRLEALRESISASEAEILGKIEISPQTFLDLSLVRAEISAQEIVLDKGFLAVLDKGGARIISISTQGKNTAVLAGRDELGEVKDIGIYSDSFYALSNRGVLQVSKGGREKVVVEPDEDWGSIRFLAVFGSNLYLLSSEGNIWRYPGFAARQAWFGKGVEPDFSQAQDMAIDGSIWVLLADGKIRKFTRGAPDAFQVKGLSPNFSSPTALYTDEDLDGVFVLDKNNNRLVEINKKGEFVKEYLWDGMGEIRDIAVSKEAGKIFLLSETKILEIPL